MNIVRKTIPVNPNDISKWTHKQGEISEFNLGPHIESAFEIGDVVEITFRRWDGSEIVYTKSGMM